MEKTVETIKSRDEWDMYAADVLDIKGIFAVP